MRITSLNIRHGGGARTSALVDYLARTRADTLAITEFRLVESWGSRHARFNPEADRRYLQ